MDSSASAVFCLRPSVNRPDRPTDRPINLPPTLPAYQACLRRGLPRSACKTCYKSTSRKSSRRRVSRRETNKLFVVVRVLLDPGSSSIDWLHEFRGRGPRGTTGGDTEERTVFPPPVMKIVLGSRLRSRSVRTLRQFKKLLTVHGNTLLSGAMYMY